MFVVIDVHDVKQEDEQYLPESYYFQNDKPPQVCIMIQD